MEAKDFILRRKLLAEKLPENSAVILYGGGAVKASADGEYPFVINRNFHYLTGIDQADSALIMLKVDKVVTAYLFISRPEEVKEKWFGRRLPLDEALQTSGIENILFIDQLESKIDTILRHDDSTFGQIDHLYLDLEVDLRTNSSLTTSQLQAQLAMRNPQLAIRDLRPELMRLRMIKSPLEIAAIRKAISFTNTGLKALLTGLKPEMFEYQARALFEYVIADRHNAEVAFPSIVASGQNGVILHYPTPKDRMKDGQLVLLDVGAAFRHYSSDISRTYPVSGKFNQLQKSIYQIVLGCNKAVIEMIKPGLTLVDLQSYAITYLTEHLLEEGIITDPEDIRKYYYHSVSHHLGLDTHDLADRSLPLEAGNVITVEPGLYFKEYGIGIRIEDDVLVTATGSENLSKAIIKEVKDIEKALTK